MNRQKKSPLSLVLAGLSGAALMFVAGWGYNTVFTQPQPTQAATLSPTLQHVKVDVFGGSAAYGDYDPKRDSYLKRAFAARSSSTNTDYTYIDHTVVGGTAYLMEKNHPGEFEQDMKRDKPQVVVFSWGLLNDMSSRHKIPVNTFGKAVKEQIGKALAAHAMVLIITPPVTQESATNDHQKIEVYINKLFAVANSFHSPNVVNIDLYHQMEAYMTAHHQTYEMYKGNSWHPNQAGHVLAGELLANDLVQKFGVGPIQTR